MNMFVGSSRHQHNDIMQYYLSGQRSRSPHTALLHTRVIHTHIQRFSLALLCRQIAENRADIALIHLIIELILGCVRLAVLRAPVARALER